MSGAQPAGGRDYWRSLEQLAETPEFLERLHREFPAGASELSDPISRRTFLGLMGASVSLAWLTGCRRPVEEIVPYVLPPEEVVLGVPLQYATIMPMGETSLGVLASAREGRPIKVDGNPLHPSTKGGSNVFMQAAVLGLYDPDRSGRVKRRGEVKDWLDFVDFWRAELPELQAAGGKGLAVLSDESASPTLARLKRRYHELFPQARWATWSPVSNENRRLGLLEAFGQKLTAAYNYQAAKVVVSLDSDFLASGGEAVADARGFIDGRRVDSPDSPMNRLYVAESAYSLTGAMADHRLRLPFGSVPLLALQLAHALAGQGLSLPSLPEGRKAADDRWAQAVARDLMKNAGECLVVAGMRQPPEVHALVAALNSALGNVGATVFYRPGEDRLQADTAEFARLNDAMRAGEVSSLIILGANPVYNAPVDFHFAESMRQVRGVVHLGEYYDETAREAEWHLPQAHWLESWGDGLSSDGAAGVAQPLIEPLLNGRSAIELLSLVISGVDERGYAMVRDTWLPKLNPLMTETHWRQLLHDGVLPEASIPPVSPVLDAGRAAGFWRSLGGLQPPSAVELTFAPDASVWDGRFANNGWLQELPDPITKLMWDNAALTSRATAERLGVKNMELVKITTSAGEVEAPIWIVPGHADGNITAALGYGRKGIGRIAEGAGFNAYPLRHARALWSTADVTITPTGKRYELSSSQDHWAMEGRPLVRESTLEEYRRNPEFAAEMVPTPDLKSLWKEHGYEEGHQWGMAIDLNACIGCNACAVGCQSENNIPIVGREAAGYGREMHWIRLDRYFNGDEEDPQMVTQPMACQHCEMAPCEQVCPVAATVHDREGLNVMVYNRCVGTRYCSNNCPYKVRRFNFFNWTSRAPELVKLAQNPDVTVRSRGVMEKCTYCVQRINRGKFNVKRENRALADGDILTACQQACPTDAIVFGDIRDPESRVAKLKQAGRNYQVLSEFNTRPRTSYLARLRNPNPELTEA